MPLVLAQGSPIFHSSCEGELGIALESCRANLPHLGLCPVANIPLQGRQGSRGCIPDSPGESGLVSSGSKELRSPLESRRPGIGFLSRVDWEIGVLRNVAPPWRPRLKFLRETGLMLRWDGKVGNPFQIKQGNRSSCRDQEGRRGSEEVVLGNVGVPLEGGRYVAELCGSHQGFQVPFRPSRQNLGLSLRCLRGKGLHLAILGNHLVFLEFRRDYRVTMGNSGCFLCWAREVQSSIRVARESWKLLPSDCRANRPHIGLCSETNVSLHGRQGSRGCIPDSPGESGLVSSGSKELRSPLESRLVSLEAP